MSVAVRVGRLPGDWIIAVRSNEPVTWTAESNPVLPLLQMQTRMEFSPGEHAFVVTYPSTCQFAVKMEAGHSYQVVGRENGAWLDGRYTADAVIMDEAPDGSVDEIKVPCTFTNSTQTGSRHQAADSSSN